MYNKYITVLSPWKLSLCVVDVLFCVACVKWLLFCVSGSSYSVRFTG